MRALIVVLVIAATVAWFVAVVLAGQAGAGRPRLYPWCWAACAVSTTLLVSAFTVGRPG